MKTPSEKIKEIEKEIEKMDKYQTREDRKIYKTLKAKLQVYKEWEHREKEIRDAIEKIYKKYKLVVLNDELFKITEKRLYDIMGINKKQKIIKVFDERTHKEKHIKMCNKIRKYGIKINKIDWILRDD